MATYETPPATPEEAREIIQQVNANNRLEGIPSDPETDENTFLYLTGQISEEENRARTLAKLRNLPSVTDDVYERMKQSLLGEAEDGSAVE